MEHRSFSLRYSRVMNWTNYQLTNQQFPKRMPSRVPDSLYKHHKREANRHKQLLSSRTESTYKVILVYIFSFLFAVKEWVYVSRMASSGMVKVACVVLMCMVVSAPSAQAAISCGTVVSNLAPCLSYLRNGGAVPAQCCNGVKSLFNAANTTPDRQQACKCMKSTAGTVSGIDLNNASTLPSKCGVNIPYKISPNTDCSKYLSLSLSRS